MSMRLVKKEFKNKKELKKKWPKNKATKASAFFSPPSDFVLDSKLKTLNTTTTVSALNF